MVVIRDEQMAAFRAALRQRMLAQAEQILAGRGVPAPPRAAFAAIAAAEASNASRYGLTNDEEVARYLAFVVEHGANRAALARAGVILFQASPPAARLAELDRLAAQLRDAP